MLQLGSFGKKLIVLALVTQMAPLARAERAIIDPYVGSVKAASLRRLQIKIQGQPALVVEKLHASGRVLARLVSWSDRVMIAIDHYGEGHLDTWEMISSEARIKLWAPAQGQFHLMDVETFKGAQRVTARWARTEAGDFELISHSTAMNGAMFDEASLGGAARSGVEAEESTEAPIDVRQRVEAAQEKSLQEAAVKVAGDCAPAAREKIVAGVAQVMMSDVALARGEAEPARFLKCLRVKGHETTANAIASRFFSTAIPEGAAPASWSLSCPKCESGAKKDTHVACSAASAKSGSFQAEGRGGKPEISVSVKSPDPAATFFHEGLHAAGVSSEREAGVISKCCGQSSGGDCKDLDHAVATRDRAQVYLSSYFNLSPQARQKVDKASRQVDKNTGGSERAVHYLSKLAEAHQAAYVAHRSGACKDETSDACQAVFREVEKKTFDQEVRAKCPPKSGDGACAQAVEELAGILGPKKGPEHLDLAQASRLIKNGLLPRGPVSYHQLPAAQMAAVAAQVGREGARNLAPSAGIAKSVPFRGPRMMTFERPGEGTSGAPAERDQVAMASLLNKQTGVVNAIVSRVAKLTSSILAAVPSQAARLQDPTAVRGKPQAEAGMSAHLKKLLTPKSPVKNQVQVTETRAPGPAASTEPAVEKRRQEFIKQMTSADETRLKSDLGKKETLKTLSDYNIGVIDQMGVRRDNTANPSRWLIYDEESGHLQFLDSDDSDSVSK